MLLTTKEIHVDILNNDLPFDIITAIFSFLDQQECINCMAVNRSWFHQVPMYTRYIWKHVRLSENDIRMPNYRREQCMRYVRSVQLDSFREDEELYIIMNKLMTWGCDEIESLTFIGCRTLHQRRFIHILQQLTCSNRRLTRLSITTHNSDIVLTQLLAVCPELTHLTFIPLDLDKNSNDIYELEPLNTTATMNKNMIYLDIRGLAGTRKQLEPILKRCPNLQYLIGIDTTKFFSDFSSPSDRNSDSNSISTTTFTDGIQLSELFSWCPKLIYFTDKGTYYTTEGQGDLVQNAIFQSYHQHSSLTSIRRQYNNNNKQFYYLTLCDNNSSIAPFVIRHQETLECLILSKSYNDNYQGTNWPSVFRRSLTNLGQLRTLICSCIKYNEDPSSIIHLLNRCPRLDTLALTHNMFYLPAMVPTLSQSIIEPLDVLLHLRRLDLCGYSFFDEWSVIELLKRLPALEELVIANGRLPFNNHPHIFSQYCPRLTHLNLMNITCNHSEGETILTPAMFLYQTLSSRSTLSTMQRNNSNNSSMAVCNIKHIKLLNVPPVTYKLLTAIAHIPTLTSLEARLSEMHCMNNDDEFIAFIRTLYKTVIEKLILYKFNYLHQLNYPTVTNALGNLPYLTELRFESTTMAPAKLDTKDKYDKLAAILTVWNKSKSLNKIVFCHISACGIWPSTVVQKLLCRLPTTNQKKKDYFIVMSETKQSPRENSNNDNQCWYTATVTISRQRGC
ncbi:hypothetical protein INT45_000305 [Circinella minor]|uniref:F-box domain-containing protein n=1 Tax=Circinella minor TaxID=1195481 RepID=A0A8H7VRE4_9FUNG|nr:hypothetical protein INT45_000305 [Circinella minor]